MTSSGHPLVSQLSSNQEHPMSTILRVAAAGVVCAFGAITASHAQSVTCQNAQFNPATLAKYPNLQKNCQNIVTRQGEHFAVIKAQLDRVNQTSVVVRVKQPDGSYAQRTTLKTTPEMRVLVEGKPVRVTDLSTGQELTAYVKVREPVVALAPAEETTPLVVTPIEEEPQEQVAAALPETASAMPLFGLAGGAFLFLGGLLSALRRGRRH
jgi:hypothetical protein